MHKIGIDFGTSFCTSSRLNPVTGKPEVITFHETGLQKMPSLVYYSPDGVMVGDSVADMLENSANMPEEDRTDLFTYTHASIKRQLQRSMKIYGRDGQVMTQPKVISEILYKIKCNAEQTCFRGQSVESVVLTHPVRFAEWQKEILVEAARLAGFTHVELMEEPVAAAKGYAASGVEVGNGILVYDFGGGTFDVAFVSIDEEGEYRVPVSPEGDLYCGGDDLDAALYHYWESEIKRELNRFISSTPAVDVGFLMRCRKHKESLSVRSSIDQYEILPPPGFVRYRLRFDRETFESLIEECVGKTITRTRSLLEKVKSAGFTVDTVVLIGGSSRLPLVTKLLKSVLPVEPLKTMLVDSAVAVGAVVPDKVYTEEELKELCKKASLLWSKKQYGESVRLWKKAAGNGCMEAQLNLGICCHLGLGMEVDFSLAANYYDAASAQGDATAAYNRAVLFWEDLQSSEQWIKLVNYLQTNKLLASGSGALSPLLAIKASPRVIASKTVPSLTDMIFVEGGTFKMGSETGDGDERPVHSVTLSDFYIGKYPVTQQLWMAVMFNNNPSYFRGDDLPVESVSWFDCVSFCNVLSRRDGFDELYLINGTSVTLLSGKRGYRLPTEAEWEFAARGGVKSKGYTYASGNDIDEVGWYSGNSGSKTHSVGQKRANELVLYDMSGNVCEWCWDWKDTYLSTSQVNPLGPSGGMLRVSRGGGWNGANSCRASSRNYRSPGFSFIYLGFRLVFVS